MKPGVPGVISTISTPGEAVLEAVRGEPFTYNSTLRSANEEVASVSKPAGGVISSRAPGETSTSR